MKQMTDFNVDLYVSRFDARHQDSVTIHKFGEGVSDWITRPPNPDGLHHARVAQLTNTQLSIKQLRRRNKHPVLKCELTLFCSAS